MRREGEASLWLSGRWLHPQAQGAWHVWDTSQSVRKGVMREERDELREETGAAAFLLIGKSSEGFDPLPSKDMVCPEF